MLAEVISFYFAGGKFLCGLGGYGDHAGPGDLPRAPSKGSANTRARSTAIVLHTPRTKAKAESCSKNP